MSDTAVNEWRKALEAERDAFLAPVKKEGWTIMWSPMQCPECGSKTTCDCPQPPPEAERRWLEISMTEKQWNTLSEIMVSTTQAAMQEDAIFGIHRRVDPAVVDKLRQYIGTWDETGA